MRGKIGTYSIIAIVFLILGWTGCIIFEDYAFLTLDMSIGTSEVIAIVVDVVLALFIVNVLEKSAQNSRVEKDFYLKELDDVLSIFSEMEQLAAKQIDISFDVIVEALSRSRRVLNRFWKLKIEHNPIFSARAKKQYNLILKSIKQVDTYLTDTKAFEKIENTDPVKITNGKIYLNKSVRPSIEDSISAVKKDIFVMKLLINNE